MWIVNKYIKLTTMGVRKLMSLFPRFFSFALHDDQMEFGGKPEDVAISLKPLTHLLGVLSQCQNEPFKNP